MHRPSAVDIRFSARSCPYCLDDDGVGQNSVCNDGFFGVNDGFYECDDGGPGEYDDNGEDDTASIFTIILCLTTLHRCCTSASMVFFKVLCI